MQYCECTNDFVNAIIDDYFNSFEIRKYYINKYEQPYYAVRISKLVEDDTEKVKRKYTYLAYFAKPSASCFQSRFAIARYGFTAPVATCSKQTLTRIKTHPTFGVI